MKEKNESSNKISETPSNAHEEYAWKFEIKSKFSATFITGLLFGIMGLVLGELSFPKLIATQPVTVDSFHIVEKEMSDTATIQNGSTPSRNEATNYRNGTVSIEPATISRWSYNFAFFQNILCSRFCFYRILLRKKFSNL